MHPYRIPLLDRAGQVVAHALVDGEDWAALRAYRWHRNSEGYASRGQYSFERYRRNGRGTETIKMHRQILGLMPGDGKVTDHINRDKLDNRRANLRVVTQAQNLQNHSACRGASSRFRGVGWHKATGMWQAEVQLSGKRHYLGIFERERDAALAAQAFRDEHMPWAQPDPVLAETLRMVA